MKNKKILFFLILVVITGIFYGQNSETVSWLDAGNKSYEFTAGPLKITMRPKAGSFNFAVLNDDEKYIPVLSTKNEGAANTFYLKAGKKIYHLSSSSDIKAFYRKTDTGISVKYDVSKIASVVILFTPLKSSSGSDYDVVKISAEITNTGSKRQDMSLKVLLDTILGESSRYHFSTSEGVNIKGETSYRSMKNEKWFLSKNTSAALEILLYGADITPPEYVALASYSTLDTNSWEPDVSNFRSFDTVLSYNNSGIGINWGSSRVEPEAIVKDVFYVSMASDGRKPAGHKYIEAIQNPLALDEDESEEAEVKNENAGDSLIRIPENQDAENANSNVNELSRNESDKTGTVIPSAGDFSVNKLTNLQMSPEYIQALLDKIAELEDEDAVTNREEIRKLHSELDVILEALRQ